MSLFNKLAKRNNDSNETVNTELYDKYTECVHLFLNQFEKTYGGKIRRVMLVHLCSWR